MKKTAKKLISLLLAFTLVFSVMTPALAASPDLTNYKITTIQGKKVWVLKAFLDQSEIPSWFVKFANETRIAGVVLGDNGNFVSERYITAEEMYVVMCRYYYPDGYVEKKPLVQGASLGGDISFDGGKTRCDAGGGSKAKTWIKNMWGGGVSLPTGTMSRAQCIYLCGLAAQYGNSDLKLSDFSNKDLGKWSRDHLNPGGVPDRNIYPIIDMRNGKPVLSQTNCTNMFIKGEESEMTPIQIQAANLLMYTGVLEGTGSGLVPGRTITRGEMIKLLCQTKTVIPEGGSGGNLAPPEELTASASLSVSAKNASINYKDLNRGETADARVTFDGSKSEGASFVITSESKILGSQGTIVSVSSASSAKKNITLSYDADDLIDGKDARNYVGRTFKDTVTGKIVVKNQNLSDQKTDTDTLTISITNEAPTAKFIARTDMLTGKTPDYSQNFFYINNPITITDSSSDYEAPLDETTYVIRKDGANIAVVTDFAAPEFLDNFISEMTASGQKIHITFKTPGVYTIQAIAIDECGEQDVSTKTIRVTGEPEKPTANIKANSYAFIGTPASVKDASTDPNDDIVKWTWTDPLVQVEKTPEPPVEETPEPPVEETPAPVAAAEPEVTWGPATGKYSKTYRDGVGATKPSYVDGTITFNAIGIYQIGLTVEDATGLTDATTHEIKVIKDIPVPNPEPGPVDPDPGPGPDPDPNPGGHFPHMDGDTLVVKQNRLFTISIGNSLNPPSSPIQWEKTEWSYGTDTGYHMSDLKIDTASKDIKVKRFVPTEPGEFYITIVLHNPYSDGIAATDPTNEDLAARTSVVKVRVVPDEPPVVAIQVNNANPNFHDNPSSINVKVVATASSPDFDTIDHYDWKLVRDSNNNGNFNDDAVLQDTKNTKQSEIGLTVKFTNGNTSPFQASVKVTEAFGQPTIKDFVDASDYLTASASETFDVNWTPCISFKMRDWAYTDDILTITTVQKDENVDLCKVEWSLWKKTGETYTQVDTSKYDTWKLQNSGGQIRIPDDGFYRLQAVITDAEGHTETFYPEKDIRIYHLPVAVISDNPDYRWESTIFNFKESRKFMLDGNSSYVDDSTGPALHQLDRNRDSWSITPLDGQPSESIYVMNDNGSGRLFSTNSSIFSVGLNKFEETLAILEPGRYNVSYQVTNTYGKKSPVINQIITIAEDMAPVISGVVEPIVKRGPADGGADVTLSITNLALDSKDSDLIGDYAVEVAYDSNNDHQFTDETWTPLMQGTDYTVEHSWSGHVDFMVKIMRQNVGDYKFRITVKEVFGQETLPIVPDSKIKDAERIFDTKIDNVSPDGTFSTKRVVKGDIVFAIGQSEVAEQMTNAINSFRNRFGSETGLNLMDIYVDEVKTSTVTAETKFPWKVYNLYGSGFGSGDGQFQAVGTDYYYQGYGSEAPIDHLYYDDGRNGTRKFTFDIDMTGYNSCATVIPGFLFGCSEQNGGFSGYISMMWHDKISVYSFTSNGHEDFTTNGIGNIATSGGLTSYQFFDFIKSAPTVSTSLQKSVTMKYEGGTLTITDGTVDILSVACPSTGTGYGVAAINSGHGCGQRSYTKFKNFALETGTVKSLSDALSDVSWRDGAERFVIYVDDVVRKDMTAGDTPEYAKLMASLLAENIHLIALGSNDNSSQLQALLSNLTQLGMYYKNKPYSPALNEAESFIKSVLLTAGKDTMYVLLNEKLNYNKIYNDFNGDPQWYWEQNSYVAFQKNPSILAQRWKYYHEQDYFDNPLGIADFTSTEAQENWMAKEVSVFDKTGRYFIDYSIKDNPVPNKADNSPDNPFDEYRYWSHNYANDQVNQSGQITNPYAELFVHRRPLAEFDFVATKTNDVISKITVTNQAYDLDHQFSRSDKGLNLYEWKWKFASDSGWRGSGTFTTAAAGQQWINSQLINLNTLSMTNVLIQYRVRDIDGFPENEIVSETVKSGSKWVVQQNEYLMNQGVWSDAKTVWVTNAAQIPVARFKTSNNTYLVGEDIEITDSSYSPNGDNIANWEFTVTRNGTDTKRVFNYKIGSTCTSVTDMQSKFGAALTTWIDGQKLDLESEKNKYRISLVVTDDKAIPLKSDPYAVTIQITSVNTPPDISVPDTDNPDDPGGADGNGTTIFGKNNPTVYEYDAYDANLTNPYYTCGGAVQKRGTELLNWTLKLHDPDNDDKYGTANDTDNYKVSFKLDRFLSSLRTNTTSSVSSKTYPTKTVTAAQAMQNSRIAPFTTPRAENLGWGTYRITTAVTDVPKNGATGKTTTIITNPDTKPLHLYVIPKLSIADTHYTFNGILDNPERIAPGDAIQVSAVTNDRSTGARIIYTDGDGAKFTQELSATKGSGDTLVWDGDFIIPGNLEDDDLFGDSQYSFEIETYTNYGARAGEETRTKKTSMTVNILPLRLYDFEITGITDPAVQYNNYPVTVPHLAFDTTDYSTLMKKGYAVNFDVYSKGLRGDTDSIRIRPTFYGYNTSTGRYDMPLDMYYKNTEDMYVLATTNPSGSPASGDDFEIYKSGLSGTLLGTLRELNLTTENRTMLDGGSVQQWSARYGIPGSAVFVRQGQTLGESNLYSGGALLVFDIEAMKNDSPKYNYIGKGQWDSERRDDAGQYLVPEKAVYQDGAIIIIDAGKSALDNYESRPVWTKH